MKRLIDFSVVLGIVVFSVAIFIASVYPTIKFLQVIE
jgi:hypothetical protein